VTPWINACAAWLQRLRGWRRLAVAFVAGALTAAALPPFHVIPVLWIAFPVLLWQLDGCRTWHAALRVGWAFGFGHFFAGLTWITNAFYVDADAFGVFAAPALLSLSFGLALLIGITAVVTVLIPPPAADAACARKTKRRAARALLFAAAWMTAEWVRSWIFTGFPWNPMAAVWAESKTPVGLAVLQSVSVIGTYGLSLVTVAAAALTSVLGHAPRERAAWTWAAAPLGVLAVLAVIGSVRLAFTPTTFVPDVNLRLVQPDIPQADKWKPQLRRRHLMDYVRLSLENQPPGTTAVIWGESAVPFFLDQDEEARHVAAMAAPPGGTLITGGDRAESNERIFNSLYVIAPDSRILATYDKSHLVPFGEYMPLRRFIPFQALTEGGDFAAGPGLKTLTAPGLPPFSPLICFEVIFPGHVIAPGKPRPRWLLNVSNDSWFGTATGPYQHFAIARLRAIEEGLPLVRTVDTGISGVVDGNGRVLNSLGLDHRGVIDSRLPDALPMTIFGIAGNIVALVLAFATTVLARRLYLRST
jgi:apolipoprotein N-acyltransferase